MPKLRELQKGDGEKLIPVFKFLTDKEIFFNEKALIEDDGIKCLVVEEEGKLVGFGSLIIHKLPIKGVVGRIEDVVIDGNQQSNGFGKLLVKELISIAKKENVREIDLTSNRTRIIARKFYQSLGFEIRETDTFRLKLQ